MKLDRFYEVCKYAYYHNYEISECCNLLTSKGYEFTLKQVEEAYSTLCSCDSGKYKDNPYND